MTSDELLELARAGDLEALGPHRKAIAAEVQAAVRNGEAALACELVGRAWRIWLVRSELDEGSAAAAAALNAPGAESAGVWFARALYADGLFAFRAGDRQRSVARNEEALWVARKLKDARGECDALTGLARVALRDGRYDEVVALAREARQRASALGDRAAGASPLHLEAAGMRLQQNYRTARELYLESLQLNAALGNDAGWRWSSTISAGSRSISATSTKQSRASGNAADTVARTPTAPPGAISTGLQSHSPATMVSRRGGAWRRGSGRSTSLGRNRPR